MTLIPQQTRREVLVRERDTVIRTEPDSAMLRAIIECDSNYNAVLRRLETRQGERIQVEAKQHTAPLSPTTRTHPLTLEVHCREDSLLQEIHLRDSIINTFHTQTAVIETVPRYYRVTNALFWITLLLIACRIILKTIHNS